MGILWSLTRIFAVNKISTVCLKIEMQNGSGIYLPVDTLDAIQSSPWETMQVGFQTTAHISLRDFVAIGGQAKPIGKVERLWKKGELERLPISVWESWNKNPEAIANAKALIYLEILEKWAIAFTALCKSPPLGMMYCPEFSKAAFNRLEDLEWTLKAFRSAMGSNSDMEKELKAIANSLVDKRLKEVQDKLEDKQKKFERAVALTVPMYEKVREQKDEIATLHAIRQYQERMLEKTRFDLKAANYTIEEYQRTKKQMAKELDAQKQIVGHFHSLKMDAEKRWAEVEDELEQTKKQIARKYEILSDELDAYKSIATEHLNASNELCSLRTAIDRGECHVAMKNNRGIARARRWAKVRRWFGYQNARADAGIDRLVSGLASFLPLAFCLFTIALSIILGVFAGGSLIDYLLELMP